MEIHVMDDDAVEAQRCYKIVREDGEEEEEGGKERRQVEMVWIMSSLSTNSGSGQQL
jgi:hypothetical protein